MRSELQPHYIATEQRCQALPCTLSVNLLSVLQLQEKQNLWWTRLVFKSLELIGGLLCNSYSRGGLATSQDLLASTGHSARKKRKGRQKKRWEDNIKEWTEMDFASSTTAAEDRIRWKGTVGLSLWSPNDLTRLWDRLALNDLKCAWTSLSRPQCHTG